jgi:tetratricopeptide (TPR) repeat protein
MCGVAPDVAYAVALARVELIRARQATIETINRAVMAQEDTSQGALSAEVRLGLAVAAKASQLASFARYEKRASSSLRKRLMLVDSETGDAGPLDKQFFDKRIARSPIANSTLASSFSGAEHVSPPMAPRPATEPQQEEKIASAAEQPQNFGQMSSEIFAFEPTLPATLQNSYLREAAVNWHCAQARTLQKPAFGAQQLQVPQLIQRLADIARRLVHNGELDEAIFQLDAGLLAFSSSAVLATMRACAGLIADRPSGIEIIEKYKDQQLNGLKWEHVVFYQLDRLRKAPSMRQESFVKVENALACTRPSRIELRKIRHAIDAGPEVKLPSPVYEREQAISAQELHGLQQIARYGDAAFIYRPVSLVEADAFAGGGDYLFAFLIYFRELALCRTALARKWRSRKRTIEAHLTRGRILNQVANICLWLLQRGKFERVLSTVLQALLYFPGAANLHACRAATLMFLNRSAEASALYNRLIESKIGVAAIEMTFNAIRAGGWENALMDDVSKRIRQRLGESGVGK